MIVNNLQRLVIWRGLLDDPLLPKVCQLVREKDKEIARHLYYQVYAELLEVLDKEKLSGNLWQEYLLTKLLQAENIFTLQAERKGRQIEDRLCNLAQADIELLWPLFKLNWQHLQTSLNIHSNYQVENFAKCFNGSSASSIFLKQREILGRVFQEGQLSAIVLALVDHYYQWGCGDFARYRFFRWTEQQKLSGIANFDPVRLENLIGYQYQKDIILKNSQAFLMDKPCNNVLLFGDRGTGKSSTVKAVGNEYFARGLRIIELPKDKIMDLSQLLTQLQNRALKFIVFLDDLSFEEFEIEYKHFKAMLEGGLELKPHNVLIYATSNRKHLIKETWQDQQQMEEIRVSDAIQEKLSLVDRFGLTITFGSPDQKEYLEIVTQLALQNGVTLPEEELHHRALKWELWYHGRSGRTAQQFINYLLSDIQQ